MTGGPRRPGSASFPHDQALLDQVLRVYRPGCRYLRSGVTRVDASGILTQESEFAIPASFYIDDTGHFNAVEFTLCYNQMMYFAVAKGVREGIVPELGHWDIQEFWRRQLPAFLITNLRSTFRTSIRAAAFSGRIRFPRIERVTARTGRPMIVAETTCAFWDDAGGESAGEVRLVIVEDALAVGGERPCPAGR